MYKTSRESVFPIPLAGSVHLSHCRFSFVIMHYALAALLASLPLFSTASPVTHLPCAKIDLNKRSDLTQADGSVNAANLRAHLAASMAKINRGLAAYEKNTGSKHPLATNSTIDKRATGKDPLTDDNAQLWYGSISVGTPSKTYTGKLSFYFRTLRFNY